MAKRLRIAVQKSGRLSEISLSLLEECGIKLKNNGKGTLLASASNFPLDILYLRDDDIPQYVEDGTADLGILGENVVAESGVIVKTLKKLDFGRCRLSLAVPRNVDYQDLNWFNGKRIATSYPNLLKKFMVENHIKAEVHTISGSVEIAPNIGLADAICDLVSSGSTLLSNGLKEVEILFKSEAVMVANQNIDAAGLQILNKLLFRLDAVMTAKNNKYIILNAPNESVSGIISVLPGIKSPTVVPLAAKGWSAIHSVLNEEQFWDVIDDLKSKGAQGILVIPIEKMIV
jgi:ATP phosphoribosyltransferase